MNQRWETYMKTHKALGQARLKAYREEYCNSLPAALDIASVEDDMLTAFLISEIIKLKTEVNKLKKEVKNDE